MLSSAATPRPSGTASAGQGGTFEPGIAGTISSPIKTPWGSGQLHGEERPRGALDLLLCDVSDERGFRTEGKRESPRPDGRREAPPRPPPGHRTVPTPVTAAPPRSEVGAGQNGFCFSHSKHF